MKKGLYLTTNYNKEIEKTDKESYIIVFVELINNFTHYLDENAIIHNAKYKRYIFIKGLITLKHIFGLLMTYTKNIELVLHHCQKSYCYYTEFIEQIMEDNNILNINMNDAIMFLYRKTIFDINQEHRKKIENSDLDREIIKSIYKTIHNITSIIVILLESKYKSDDTDDDIKEILLLIIKKFNNVKRNKNDYIDSLRVIYLIINKLSNTLKYDKLVNKMDDIINIINRKKIDIDKLEENIDIINENLDNSIMKI
jgi:hypothetical protein